MARETVSDHFRMFREWEATEHNVIRDALADLKSDVKEVKAEVRGLREWRVKIYGGTAVLAAIISFVVGALKSGMFRG